MSQKNVSLFFTGNMNDSFSESVSPTLAIRAILREYPFSVSILRELLQNSDDARATKQIFVLDKGPDPALIAYNDSQFEDDDWEAIQTIHESSKKADTSKIGKYGVGFRACYHVTDRPQILSGSSFALLDPLRLDHLHPGGTRMSYKTFLKEKDYHKHFGLFSGITKPSSFPGTVIRLPLRSSPSKLSEHVVLVQELDLMIKDYINEELNMYLLFLDNLRTIEVWEAHGATPTCLAWTKSVKTAERQSGESLRIYDLILSNSRAKFSWRIVQTQNTKDEAKSRLSSLVGGKPVNCMFEKHKLCSDVRIAYLLSSDGCTSGRLFTFLPLPFRTAFPVHIHALFALTSSRQGLRNRNVTGIAPGSDHDVLIKWNDQLFKYYIPQAWCQLLKTLIEDPSCEDIFDSWPPYCSSITSGDGSYWQNILQWTLNAALQSGLAIWPKVSESDTRTYVDLKSSLVVACGQVDWGVLVALAQLGLTLVQLPPTHLELLDKSIIKLSPRVARDKLISADFDGLTGDQRKIICGYFLSDEDFNSVYGLPLFPILNGSYVCLKDRRTVTGRYTALTKDEVDVFGATAWDAISLDQVHPKVAALVGEKGTTKANVDLLSPPSVVAYLSREPEPRSEELLLKLWSWLSGWDHRDRAMVLLKANSSLCLIPTLKGPQLVSSTVFRAPGDPLFEKLGLAFISSLLPISVVQFLDNHGVIKDTGDMNVFLSAIDLTAIQPLSEDEAKLVFAHISISYRSLSPNNLAKLRKIPVFPVLVPRTNVQSLVMSNAFVQWRPIDGLKIEGISPMSLIPLIDDINFLDESCFSEPSYSVLKALRIPVLGDGDVLLLALSRFSSQPKFLRASFVSYIRKNHRSTNNVVSTLKKARFIKVSDGTLKSPMELIDPHSGLKRLFSLASSAWIIEDDYDREMLSDLQSLGMMETSLTVDIARERISYISSNHTSDEARIIACSLLSLMNDPNFNCFGLAINSALRWLPTQVGLVSSKDCIDCGRQDTDLFDEVLVTLRVDETIPITPSFRQLLQWDRPLPFEVLTKQLDRVLGRQTSEMQYRKVRAIIRELAGRQPAAAHVKAIQNAIAERPWVPTESGTLALPSRAVFVAVPGSNCFHQIGFSRAEKVICWLLRTMGCHERPSVSAVISELGKLREKAETDETAVQQAVELLEILPDSITPQEQASLLVPIDTGDLVPFHSGVCYFKGGINFDDGKTTIAHHLIGEKLADKIGLKHLGVDEAENDIDLGGKPITIIRNTLKQYDPKQFFTEFIANASDAGAKQFNIVVDDHKGPTKRLYSEGLAVFQGESLVVHNDGIFSRQDFMGILQTGTGGKRGRTGVIGHFGLGALSMFHFTELAMIVSGDHVLFLSPSKQNFSFRGKHTLLLSLKSVKRFYADHLEPLNGLFGFDISSTESYKGTLFRLPLRNGSHLNQDSVSTVPWNATEIQEMLLMEFNKLAYKSLLFTGLRRIEMYRRRDRNMVPLCVIESTRVPGRPSLDDSYNSEIVTFNKRLLSKWLIITMDVNIPERFKKELAQKYDIHHLLPMRIAAMLDSEQVQKLEHNLFCSLPLPVTTHLPAHISAPLILEQERRNVRIDCDRIRIESQYNQWLLSSEIPRLYLCLLERLLEVRMDNTQWWPGVRSRNIAGMNVPSKIFFDAFWDARIFKESSRRIFASKCHPMSFLSPKDVILFSKDAGEYSGCSSALSTVFSATQPLTVVELPQQIFEYATKAQLRSVDGAFVKSLLQGFDLYNRLTLDEICDLLLYLMSSNVSLNGLSLIPLEDGSYADITSIFKKTNYVVGKHQTAAYTLFNRNRLVRRKFAVPESLLKLGVNISSLSDAGIVELVKEHIKPAQEFLGGEADRAWIAAFWDANLIMDPKMLRDLPLIPTLKPLHFISLGRVNDPSVTIVDADKSSENFDYGILQKIGMTVVLRKYTWLLVERKGKLTAYTRFLQYVQANLSKGLAAIRDLQSSDREKLSGWVRQNVTNSEGLGDVACELPVWPVQQYAEPTRLGSLNEVDVLPASMPSSALLPFSNHAVIDWEAGMRSIKKRGCSAERITQLLHISSGDILSERKAYKKFLINFLNLETVKGCSLLVPNGKSVLAPVERLFEHRELFIAAFKATPERLLSNGFDDIAGKLMKYGLNQECRLDLPMFIECAKAFHQEVAIDGEDNSKRVRSEVLYRHFNGLSMLYRRDAYRCTELNRLRFIPRNPIPRRGYEGINLGTYMQRRILSPSDIVVADYEAICWSQRGQVDPQPNGSLRGTYENLGIPTGKEVVEHLKVLAEIGQSHGYRPALLADLKATYKWLNEHVDVISADIANESSNRIFLNVDNPDSDEWIWHSAIFLVIKDLQDVGQLREVKHFLQKYDDLLKAAGAGTIEKVTAKPVAVVDKTAFYQRKFCELRRRGFDVSVTFKAKDHEYGILPAHKAWLIMNSEHFLQLFITSGLGEVHRQDVEVEVPDYSSLCVKEVIDWMYVGEMSESITSPSGSDEEKQKKLDLALEMLSLSHYWEVTELHERLQEFIINAPDFINPYWYENIYEHAGPAEARELLRACEEFKEKNRYIINRVQPYPETPY